MACLFVAGCSGDEDNPCKSPPDCDIANAQCQVLVWEATACTRDQQKATMPSIQRQTPEEFRAYLVGKRGEPDENDQVWDDALRALGLLPESNSAGDASADVAVDAIVAYYDNETKIVTIIDRDEVADRQEGVFVLSHEFTHALQDQAVDLHDFRVSYTHSTDSSMSVRTLIEGEATVVSNAVMATAIGKDSTYIDWDTYARQMKTSLFNSVAKSDAPFFAAIQLAPYAYGVAGLSGPWLEGGNAAIAGFYDTPRTSLVDWNLDTPLGSTAVESVGCIPSGAPDGYVSWGDDHFGPIGALAVVLGSGAVQERLAALPTFLRGDVVVVFRAEADGDDGVAVAWTTRWASSDSATTFASQASSQMPTAHVQLSASEVTIHVASNPGVSTTWAFACGSADELPSAASGDSQESAIVRRMTRLGSLRQRGHQPRQ